LSHGPIRRQGVAEGAAQIEDVPAPTETVCAASENTPEEYVMEFKMSIKEINEAVRKCVRDALGKRDPLKALQNCLEALKAKGWRLGDVDMVRNAALRMLSVIYDVSAMVDEGS
jgi:hypothetical protein